MLPNDGCYYIWKKNDNPILPRFAKVLDVVLQRERKNFLIELILSAETLD